MAPLPLPLPLPSPLPRPDTVVESIGLLSPRRGLEYAAGVTEEGRNARGSIAAGGVIEAVARRGSV